MKSIWICHSRGGLCGIWTYDADYQRDSWFVFDTQVPEIVRDRWGGCDFPVARAESVEKPWFADSVTAISDAEYEAMVAARRAEYMLDGGA